MTNSFESILDESISALQAGVPLEEILDEVPQYATELRPLLYAATILADPNPELIPEKKKAELRSQYLAQATELAPPKPTLRTKAEAIFKITRRRTTRTAVLSDLSTFTITILLTLLMGFLLLSYAASFSIPGDFLYGIKRISEDVQLTLTFSPQQRTRLEQTFNQRRLAEMEQLLDQKRTAVVTFQGNLDTKGEKLWVVEGYTIFLAEDVAVQGEPQAGDRVEVVGLLRPNSILVADSIERLE